MTPPQHRKVIVHVGAPKTGTSFLQDLLFTHREALAEQGILYPADRFDAHFLAALDLMELQWGGLEKQAVGAWDRLAEQVRGWTGTVVISHEILATASPAQVARAIESFGDCEVHVLVSARDLVRQVPAEWQENVKHRRVVGYREFLDKITDPRRKGPLASWFWACRRSPTSSTGGAGRCRPSACTCSRCPGRARHATCCGVGSPGVLGIDPDAYDPTDRRANPSLGVPETALVRRINERVNNGVLANEDYRQFVRELLAHRTLSAHTGSARLALPPDVRAWASDLCDTWVEVLTERGYDVVGDLDDLRPGPPELDPPFVDPDEPDEQQVADAAMESIVVLLQEAARLQALEHQLREDVHAVQRELDRSRGLWFRVKRKLVHLADGNRAAALGLAGYRRLRGRSSRSA